MSSDRIFDQIAKAAFIEGGFFVRAPAPLGI